MSAENVQIVRALLDCWKSPRALEHYHEDVVMEFTYPMPGFAAEFHGLTEMRRFWLDWLRTWDIDVHDLQLRARGDRVLSTWRQTMTARASDVTMDQRHAAVWTLRDGKVERVVYYLSAEEAEAALNA